MREAEKEAFQNRTCQRKARVGRGGPAAWGAGYRATGCFGFIRVDQVNHFRFQWKDISTLYRLNVKQSIVFLQDRLLAKHKLKPASLPMTF